jgi:hypothetical protein
MHDRRLRPPARLLQHRIFLRLIGLALQQELNHAVETGVQRDAQEGASVVRRQGQRLARSDPRLQLEQASLATETQQMLGIVVSRRFRPRCARLRGPAWWQWGRDGRRRNGGRGGRLLIADAL